MRSITLAGYHWLAGTLHHAARDNLGLQTLRKISISDTKTSNRHSRSDVLVQAGMFFDGCDPRQQTVDLFSEA
jgi:hypothetical protein